MLHIYRYHWLRDHSESCLLYTSITLSFAIAAIGCCFAGLCYAEFASMIPVAGSAYTYSYATMGELIAWIIGWDLVLEYTVAAVSYTHLDVYKRQPLMYIMLNGK